MTVKAARWRALDDWNESTLAAYQPRLPAVRALSALDAGFLFARRCGYSVGCRNLLAPMKPPRRHDNTLR